MFRLLLLTLVLTGSAGAVLAADTPATIIDKADTCRACHSADGFDLRGAGPDAIAAKTRAIRDGSIEHPPGIAALSDDEISALAKLLDSDWN